MNSAAMIHTRSERLATRPEAEKWFNVQPPDAAMNVISLSATHNK
jgi:hypothetical protein